MLKLLRMQRTRMLQSVHQGSSHTVSFNTSATSVLPSKTLAEHIWVPGISAVPSNPVNSTIPDCTASPLNLQGSKCTLSTE